MRDRVTNFRHGKTSGRLAQQLAGSKPSLCDPQGIWENCLNYRQKRIYFNFQYTPTAAIAVVLL